MSDLDNINLSFEQKIEHLKTKEELQILKTEFFGKSGQITNKFKTSAQSEWSTEVDGRFTTKGGAGAAINNFTLQKYWI